MIPAVNNLATVEDVTLPSKDYKLNMESNCINGYVDDLEAMRQVVFKILNTERYRYIIYSWDYGIELEDLYGESVAYVCSELKRRINEALEVDDRIIGTENFEFEIGKGVVTAKFTVNTVFGDVDAERRVEI